MAKLKLSTTYFLFKKVNSAPKLIDEQEMPRKMQMLARMKDDLKNKKKTNQKESKMVKDDGFLDSTKHMG